MKKFFLLCLALAACDAPGGMTALGCKEMCKPKMVDRFDKDGCFCEGSQKAK